MNEYDVIVVGAGPAGLTSALYLARANKKVLVLESNTYGGRIINANKIVNYPGMPNTNGVEFATNLYNQVIDFGVEVKFETVVRVDENKMVTTNENTYKAKAVILATGTSNKKLEIENEDKYLGKGLSYCATCDGNFFKNKKVAVVGGGETALEDALYLSNLCEKVYVINKNASFDEDIIIKEELDKNSNVQYVFNSSISKINGDDNISSIDVKNSDGDISNIEVNGLFIAVGQTPNSNIFKNIVDVDEKGFFKKDLSPRTKTKGIYVAGDCVEKELRQLTTAVGDGSLAATLAIKDMKGE